MSDDYYPYPWQIWYSQWQIRWLLDPEAWDSISDGHWPFSTTDDTIIYNNTSHHADFEMISLIKAEMDDRIASVGRDGDMCVCRYYKQYTEDKIAKIFGIPYKKVGRRIKRAMRYMAGKARKRTNYSEWIQNGWRETPRL